ncbi:MULTISPECIES: RNA-binding protein [Methanobacterium]|jgi:RNA binding exosome subunit|uniref:Exosome protein n=1 Tax=Methanobacterium bryantii TaxID=2161 RepID=A0A2A2H1Y4_METBR|nr:MULTISPECIES: RNA-binding protein [Methanobacterium]OEC87421.1 exosome protein [Methanobacterium sp. A39]PAV03392.1 exosome protein [Methanobacterium bryantii]
MIHNISYRVFVYGTENEEKVKEAVQTLFPNSHPQTDTIEGYFKNPVLILHDKISKNREIKNFIHILEEIDESSKKQLRSELENKMDERGNLFLRFDKQRAYLGDLKIIKHGDAIHVKINIAAYPAKKEKAMEVARDIFGV